MKSQIIHTGDEKPWAIAFESGDAVAERLEEFAAPSKKSITGNGNAMP